MVLDQAISYAARAHAGQMRKDGTTPYIAHPMRVMTIICRTFGVDDETILAAAALHDVIEDTTKDYDSVAHHFGPDVAQLVADMSKDGRLPQERREHEYHEQIRQASWKARLIKLADCLDNVGDALDERMCGRACKTADRALELVHPDDPPVVHKAADILRQKLKLIRSS